MTEEQPSIWIRRRPLPELNAFHRGTLVAQLGIEFTEQGADYLVGRMPVDDRTRQPYGLLHGGASVALAETLGSFAAAMTVDTERVQVVGQEINANHLRAVREGHVTGTARPIHLGSRSQVWGIDIRDDAGRLVCVSRLTLALLHWQAPPGPR